MRRQALQNNQVGVLGMDFWARSVFGTFEKWAPGLQSPWDLTTVYMLCMSCELILHNLDRASVLWVTTNIYEYNIESVNTVNFDDQSDLAI